MDERVPVSAAAETNGAQNSKTSAPGRPFQKGKSGNPGGRPKGVMTKARELVDNDPTRLLAVLLELAESPTAKDGDRRAAASDFLDRGWGKAPAYAPTEGGELSELDDVQRAIGSFVDELAARRPTTPVGGVANGVVASNGEAGAA
jgi:hypothetical protein